MEYIYLTEDEIIKINEGVINEYSPQEPIGIMNANSLNMLVNLPKQSFGHSEFYPNIQKKSAILFRTIVKKHVFINGNKRTAVVALNIFLEKNGYSFSVGLKEGLEYTVKVDTLNTELDDIAFWINGKIRARE